MTHIEDVVEPDLPICDAHHHLWPEGYALEDLFADLDSGHNITSTVFVECTAAYRTQGPDELRPVGETEFVDRAAEEAGARNVAAAIVSFADLTFGERVAEVLEAHALASARFRGIRHAAAWVPSDEIRPTHTNPPEGLLAAPSFRRGFAELAPRGLSFDAWIYHPQIPELADLARAFPETTIVLDHFGGPLGIGPYAGRWDEIFDWWKPQIAELAKCPNVIAKLGGILMPRNGLGFDTRPSPATSDELVAATKDWYLYTIDHFSPQRCMFESNFPVDRASSSYRVLWNSLKKIADGFESEEKADMFQKTAVRVYRLA